MIKNVIDSVRFTYYTYLGEKSIKDIYFDESSNETLIDSI